MTAARPTSNRRRRLCIGALTGALAIGLAPMAAPYIGGNFYSLVAGEAYRSAQPSGEDIRRYAKEHGIATILNLRGPDYGAHWYEEEIATTAKLGITYIEYAMSPTTKLAPEQALELIALMRNAQKPILIHCRDGADRTGLASALYLAGLAGRSEEQAEAQLSILYGHYAIPMIGTWEMDVTWETMEPYLGFPES